MREVTFDAAPVLHQIDRQFSNSKQAAEALGVDRYAIVRWRDGMQLKERTADIIACRLGLHPIELWPDYWDRMAERDANVGRETRSREAKQQRALDERALAS